MMKRISRYKKYFLEFLVIFASITLSFLLEDNRHYRIKKDNVHYALKSIEEGLISDIEQLELNISIYDKYNRITELWLNNSLSKFNHPDSVPNYYSPLFNYVDFSGNKTGYEIFIETEGKEIINDQSLRKQISKYFTHTSTFLERQTTYEGEMVTDRVSEIMKSSVTFSYDIHENFVQRNQVQEIISSNPINNMFRMNLRLRETNKRYSIEALEEAKKLQLAIAEELRVL